MADECCVPATDFGGSVDDLIAILDERGFIVQEGEMRNIDILKLCSEGLVDPCMGNHAGAPQGAGGPQLCRSLRRLPDRAEDWGRGKPNVRFTHLNVTERARRDPADRQTRRHAPEQACLQTDGR